MSSNPLYNALGSTQQCYTQNGAVSYGTVDISQKCEGRLGFFFKSVRGLNFVYQATYLQKAAAENLVDTCCLIMYVRDILHGKGERAMGRHAFQWLLINFPDAMEALIPLIPDYGRWDDLYCLFPNYLKLSDLVWVNGNYCSNVDNQTLLRAQKVQQEVVKFVVNQLKTDWERSQSGLSISLAAKWAPTEGSSDDRQYGLVRQICEEWQLHPKGYRVRIGQMRAILKIVERFCCTKSWDQIDYSKVPAQTMKKLRKAFHKHDSERFAEWLRKLNAPRAPTVSINSKTLHPHELVQQYFGSGRNQHFYSTAPLVHEIDPVIEAQWSDLERRVREYGALEKTLVISDVSGSMYSCTNQGRPACVSPSPIIVCMALSCMIAKVAKAPWNDAVIAFSERPAFHKITGDSLHQRCRELLSIQQGLNTNFYLVFEEILKKHKQYSLSPEDLPEKVICISDMQFDDAAQGTSNIDAVDQLFAKEGLRRPKLVFWNVAGSLDFPATAQQKDVCLISGFSTSILPALMNTKEFSPVGILNDIVGSDRYAPVRKALEVSTQNERSVD